MKRVLLDVCVQVSLPRDAELGGAFGKLL